MRMVNSSEHWPFNPACLTDRIPSEFIELLIGGMSERLEAHVVLMECCGEKARFYYPVGPERVLHRYPEFCRYIHVNVDRLRRSCIEDSIRRGTSFLSNNMTQEANKVRCHMGFTLCIEPITVMGHSLAVCTTGQFIVEDDIETIENHLITLQDAGHISDSQKVQLQHHLEACKKSKVFSKSESADFQARFKKEVSRLNQMAEYYLMHYRIDKEWQFRDSCVQILSLTPADPENLKKDLQKILCHLRNFLSVRYVALFLALNKGATILPLFAQEGLESNHVSSVTFNWKKARIPGLSDEPCNLSELLSQTQNDYAFLESHIQRGVRGIGKEDFLPAFYFLPLTSSQYRGVLLIGERMRSTVDEYLPFDILVGGQEFLKGIGHIIITHAISKLALYESSQHEKRRDLIVSLTSHSIRASLHSLWDAMERVRYYAKKSQQSNDMETASENMQTIIRIIKKNVELMMDAPSTVLITGIHPSLMNIEAINFLALINTCIDMFGSQANSKRITFVLSATIEEFPIIHGDRYLLLLALSNIIENAIKYSKPDRQIRISSINPSSLMHIGIVIEDYGWGIPSEEVDRIFDQGYRSDRVRKMQRKGVGLGAYQAKDIIVRLHKGMLWATSNPFYEGADLTSHIVRFYVELPIYLADIGRA